MSSLNDDDEDGTSSASASTRNGHGHGNRTSLIDLLDGLDEESSFDEHDLLEKRASKITSTSSLVDLLDESNDDFSFNGNDSESIQSNDLGGGGGDDGSMFGSEVDDTEITSSAASSGKSKAAASGKSKAKRKNQKRAKRKTPVPKPNVSILPKSSFPQRRVNAEHIFNLLAPHLQEVALASLWDKIREFTQSLEKEMESFEEKDTPKQRKKNTLTARKHAKQLREFNTLIGRIDAFFTKGKKKKRGGISPLEKQVWARSILTQFYGGDVDKHDENSKPMTINLDMLENDKNYAPHINQSHRDRSIAVLKDAREMTMKSQLFWSKKQKETSIHTHEDGDELHLDNDSAYLGNSEYFNTVKKTHFSKSSDLVTKEAETLADHLAMSLPTKSHENLLNVLEEFSLAVTSSSTSETENESDEVKVTDADNNADSESPLSDGMQKMRVLLPNLHKESGIHLHLIAEEIAEFFYSNDSEYLLGFEGFEDKVTESRNDWDSIKTDIEEELLESHKVYCKFHQKLNEEVEKEINLENVMKEASLKNDEKAIAKEKSKSRAQSNITIKFQSLMMNDRFGPYIRQGGDFNNPNVKEICSDLVEELPKTNQLLMIDNLPIDTTEEELLRLYSRCGPIDSVKVFNLKPDLDPGELKLREIMAIKKANRMSGIKGAMVKRRKRTPVYALIQFEDEEGYKAASIDPLRIFGMIIRRHPARSIPASKLDEIYVENISKDFKWSQMNHRLSEVLSPDIQVIPEFGQRMRGNPSRCKIKFPTFEVAHYAFQRLEKMGLDSEDVTVNWIETPADAEKYWTRDIFID